MRPLLYRLAHAHGLHGQVRNETADVELILQGRAAAIDEMLQQLRQAPPPRARIDVLSREVMQIDQVFADFRILPSQGESAEVALMGDIATCAACVAELFDTDNRRYHYPFISCTDCGPRLSIQSAAPWDRAHTSMAEFALCERCAREYADPQDRRFHAEAIACEHCGPRCWLTDSQGRCVAESQDVVSEALRRLHAGEILALKALGGFQLLCAADDEQAVARLRERKLRPHKPLAVLVPDLQVAKQYALLDASAECWLCAPDAPVVVLTRQPGAQLAAAVSPGIGQIGLMLPSSPLHHMLARGFGKALICTSGNVASEPTITANDEALTRLFGIADAFVLHDRNIHTRVDDPVVQCTGRQPQVIRPGRGALRLALPGHDGGAILALGAHLKSTLALAHGDQLQLSPYIGDLDSPRCREEFAAMAQRLDRTSGQALRRIAVDAHPDYWSRHWGEHFAASRGLAVDVVQHHHAHALSVMLEHQLVPDAAPRLAIVLDGLGMSEQGELWGGEFLLVDYVRYQRLAHFQPMPLFGGVAAMREPWRNLYAHVRALDGAERLFSEAQKAQCALFEQLLQSQQHCPLTSSAGRCFDAVAAALNLAPQRLSYEAQAAMQLESVVRTADLSDTKNAYSMAIDHAGARPVISLVNMWPVLLADRERGVEAGRIAARFHLGLVQALAGLAQELIDQHQLPAQVLLSGGVFQNRLLSQLLCEHLARRNITVLTNRELPCNDSGIAAGQAASAWVRTLHRSS